MPFDGPDAYGAAAGVVALALRPKVPLWPSQWAEQRRQLTAKTSAEATRWRNSRVPYLPAIMDALDSRHPAWMVVFMKSSQVGASECGLNWVGQTIDEDPAPMGVVVPGEKFGRRWSRRRLEPMLDSTPSLREKIPRGRTLGNTDTLLQKDFPDGSLNVLSANVAIDLASDAYAKLLFDEVDRFMKEIGPEGEPVEIALRRMATFVGRKKAFLNSSPTIESLSLINPWWLASSQGHFELPCPHCGEYQALKWDNLRWPDGKPKAAAYICEHNGCVIEEHHKTDMLIAGRWAHDLPEREAEIVGFHINCLYTPIGLGDSWAENAQAWDRSKRDPAKSKVFENTRLGQTTKDPNEKLDWEIIHGRREPFPLREIPRGVLLLTAGVDVQKDRLELQVFGWQRPGRAVTIDYRIIEGDPTRPEVWNDLDAIIGEGFVSAGGVKMRLSLMLVDSGYLQEYVVAFTRTRRGQNVFASKGSSQFGRGAIGLPTYVDAKGKATVKRDPRGARQYQIGVAALKEALYTKLRADSGSDESPVQPHERHFRFSDQLPEEYFHQLCAEVFDPHKRRWVKIYERNEALDTAILCMAGALHHHVAVDRMSEADWVRLEQMYEPGGARPLAATTQPQQNPAPRRVSASGPRVGLGSEDWVIR